MFRSKITGIATHQAKPRRTRLRLKSQRNNPDERIIAIAQPTSKGSPLHSVAHTIHRTPLVGTTTSIAIFSKSSRKRPKATHESMDLREREQRSSKIRMTGQVK